MNQIALACSGPPLSSNVFNLHVHVACRIRIHANEPATAWADTPTAIIIIILNNTTVLYYYV